MTEAEWLGCPEPRPMLLYLEAHAGLTDRKLRLLDCACVRRVGHLLSDPRGRAALEVAERYSDGRAKRVELREAQEVALTAATSAGTFDPPGARDSGHVLRAAAGAAWEYRGDPDPLKYAAEALAWSEETLWTWPRPPVVEAGLAAEEKIQAALLRDVFGNPFRPVTLSPSWLTSDVVALATGIYADRAFDRMPILADALQDAGCDSDDILDHCRGPGPHVRGCWVVDLLLGKE